MENDDMDGWDTSVDAVAAGFGTGVGTLVGLDEQTAIAVAVASVVLIRAIAYAIRLLAKAAAENIEERTNLMRQQHSPPEDTRNDHPD